MVKKEKFKLVKCMSLFILLKFEGLVNFSVEDYFRKKGGEEECWLEFLCFYDIVS